MTTPTVTYLGPAHPPVVLAALSHRDRRHDPRLEGLIVPREPGLVQFANHGERR